MLSSLWSYWAWLSSGPLNKIDVTFQFDQFIGILLIQINKNLAQLTSNIGFYDLLCLSWLFLHWLIEFGIIELFVHLRSCCLMPHVDGWLLILKSFDNFKNMLLYFLDMLRINIGCHLSYKSHQHSHSVCTEERKCHSKVWVIFLQFYLLKMLLNTLIDFVWDLNLSINTAFSGRKRKSLNTKRKRVPKGMISMIARTAY